MRLNSFVALIFSALLISACHGSEKKAAGSNRYAIIGKITGLDSGWVFLDHGEHPGRMDSVRLDRGYFTFSGQADSAEFCYLKITHGGKTSYPGNFFLERGKTAILLYIDSPKLNKVTGTPTQEEYNRYNLDLSATFDAKITPLEKAFGEARTRKDKKAMDSIEKQLDAIELLQKDFVSRYAAAHPASVVAALEVYQNFSYNPDPAVVGKIVSGLDPEVKSSFYGKKLDTLLQTAIATDIGHTAPEFTLPDPAGRPVALSSLRGRVTLVDFWASWCGPCRRENPNVLSAYNAWHSKGFDIIGVSCDESKEDWLNAVKKDGLVWTQVCDMTGWKSAPYGLYGIMGIPMNYLLDKDGKIIGKGLRGDDLVAKLKEVLQ